MHKQKVIRKIGVDTGGTFTDIVMSVEDSLWTHKVLSTPRNPAHAVIKGVSEILSQQNVNSYDGVDIVHGSTVATNALLERRGARIALVTTKGFEDVLEIGRQTRPNIYDLFVQRPAPLVPAEHRFGIEERTLHTGEIQTEISLADLETLAAHLATLDLDAIAICFLFSYVNPKMNRLSQIVSKHSIYRFHVRTKFCPNTESTRGSVPPSQTPTSVLPWKSISQHLQNQIVFQNRSD